MYSIGKTIEMYQIKKERLEKLWKEQDEQQERIAQETQTSQAA
jgi:hypothetical protein